MDKPKTVTIGELRPYLIELLQQRDDAEVYFGAGDLRFKRVKNRGPVDPAETQLFQFEFNDLYAVTYDSDAAG